jgi:hypothetical protein
VVRTGPNTLSIQHVLGAITTFAAVTAAFSVALPNPSIAAPKPVTLQSLGKPAITASCKGGSYRVASSSAPLMTISGHKYSTGFALTGTNCNTLFTWRIPTGYSSLSATVILDQSDSGPLAMTFNSGRTALKFTANGHSVPTFKAASSPAHLQVAVHGLHQVSIVLPTGGSDAGILDVTSTALA